MDERVDIEELIRQVTEAVLLRLTASRPAGGKRRVLLLLPVPSVRLENLARWCEELRAGGNELTVLAAEAVIEEMERRGLRGRFGRQLLSTRTCNMGELGGSLGGGDLVVVGSLGYRFARDLAGLHDDDPVVWLTARALLMGVRVVLIRDDLSPAAGGVGADDTVVARQAGQLLRDLEALGLRPASMSDLADRVERWSQATTTLVRSLGGLVGEADIEALVETGERRLRLAAGTIVTPLAASRAAELGVELVREDE